MTDVSPCPDCGAAPAWSRCECDFVGVRAKRKHDDRIAELEAEVAKYRRVLTKSLANFNRKHRAHRQALTELLVVNVRLRTDGERLTYAIGQHGSGADLNVMDRIANIAASICPVVSDEADDIQKWYRAAIDAARKEKA